MTITNLQQFKDFLNNYINSGAYDKECTAVTSEARKFLDNLPFKNPCITLDIDDTAVSLNKVAMENDWGYPTPLLTYTWETTNLPPLLPVLSLYVYALARGFTVFFISSRSTKYQTSTEQMLKNAGYTVFEQVILKSPNDTRTTQEFKTQTRADIIAQGYDIVLNVGDHTADLQGNADHHCKIPNLAYL